MQRWRFLKIVIFILCFAQSSFLISSVRICQHNKKVIANLKKELTKEHLSENHSAVIKGLLWTIRFIEDDDCFDYIFSDYLSMLYELSNLKHDSLVRDSTVQLIKNASQRSIGRLKSIFPCSRESKWDFISVLPILSSCKINLKKFKSYYKKGLPKSKKADYAQSLSKAIKKCNYDLLTNYFVDYSFLDLARRVLPKHTFKLPKNKYKKVIKKCKKLPFVYTIKDEDGYHDQNYYATHVVCGLTCYGSRLLPKNSFTKRVGKYLKKNFHNIRYKLDDIDLLGEYIQCLKIYKLDKWKPVKEAERYLVSKQLSDGSWAPPGDADDDYYDVFHPVWTSVVALHYRSA